MSGDTICGTDMASGFSGMYTRLSPYNWASRSEKPANNSYSSLAIEPRGHTLRANIPHVVSRAFGLEAHDPTRSSKCPWATRSLPAMPFRECMVQMHGPLNPKSEPE